MYVLGAAYLDTEKQLLVSAEQSVALQRKPYLVLLHLIENRHRMITREELLERFWDGQEVYDQSVSKAIGSIRKAFGESKTSSKFIETRWGGGYRYVGPFSEESSATTDGEKQSATENPIVPACGIAGHRQECLCHWEAMADGQSKTVPASLSAELASEKRSSRT